MGSEGDYLALLDQLRRCRAIHGGAASAEEDAILDAMDGAWACLTPAERKRIDVRVASAGQESESCL